jgi:ketosteroid isomerase-like protein
VIVGGADRDYGEADSQQEATMATIRELEDKMNQAIATGKGMEAFEELYADDCTMQENSDPPRVGKAACRDYEYKFFEMIEAFHGAAVSNVTAEGNVTYSQWHNDFTLKGMPRTAYTQITQRIWRDGKIAHERFFYKM